LDLWRRLDPFFWAFPALLGFLEATWFITYDAAQPAKRPAAIPRNRFAMMVPLQKLRRAIVVPPVI
jgi:hypothetical protein